MAVSARDIRMKEFRRTLLRGYSPADVDTFLIQLAVEIDRRDRYELAIHATAPPQPAVAAAPAAPPIDPTPVNDAAGAERRARAEGEEILAEARTRAERGLRRARDRAAQMLAEAREQQERASRAEAEAQLRLAHANQQLAERASALAEEARRLDELAAWLAEQELEPESATGPGSGPVTGDAEVVPLARAADDAPLRAWSPAANASAEAPDPDGVG